MQKRETDWNRVPVVFDLPYAATLLGVTVECLHKQSQHHTFPAFKVGKLWRVRKSDLQDYIDKQIKGVIKV